MAIDGWGISCKLVLLWLPLELSDGKSTLVRVMVLYRHCSPTQLYGPLHTYMNIAHRANVICCIMCPTLNKFYLILSYLIARYVKTRVAHAPEMPRTSPLPLRGSDPGMHRGTCVTHVPWYMPGSLTSGFDWSGREYITSIPGACATRNCTYLVRNPCRHMESLGHNKVRRYSVY